MADEPKIAIEIAHVLAAAVLDLDDKRRRRDNETISGVKNIAEHLGVHANTVARLARKHGLPLNHTPGRGYWVKRWQLDRWLEAKTEAVEMRERRSG